MQWCNNTSQIHDWNSQKYLSQSFDISSEAVTGQLSLQFKTTHSAEECGLKLKVVLNWRDSYFEM